MCEEGIGLHKRGIDVAGKEEGKDGYRHGKDPCGDDGSLVLPCVEIECNDGDKKRYEIGLLKEAEERPVVVNPHDGGQKH